MTGAVSWGIILKIKLYLLYTGNFTTEVFRRSLFWLPGGCREGAKTHVTHLSSYGIKTRD